MLKKAQENLSPGVDLQAAQYLADPKMYHEYERLRGIRSERVYSQLWRIPKFRRKVIEMVRLGLFAVIIWAAISMISHYGLWRDIYQSIVTAL